MKRWFAILVVGLTLTPMSFAQETTLKIAIAPGAQLNTPITIPLSVPQAWAKFDEVAVDVITGRDLAKTVGQLTAPGITTESIKPSKDGLVRRDLHVVLTTKCLELVVHFKTADSDEVRFAWGEKKGEHEELLLKRPDGLKPVMRYMNRPYDPSTKDAREKSYKVFHHLYDPAGKRFVTNGGFTNDNITEKLLYPHHRGLMYGFNKCTYGPGLKSKADTWHCTNDAHVAHEKTLSQEAGPVLGRHRVLLGWHGEKNVKFAVEERELTVYRVNGGTLVEFASRLKTTGGPVKLDGDPQHAGFQFRAHNDVASAASQKQTYYLHPDGTKGDMGKERNWPRDKTMVDLPWYAVSFVLGTERFSAVYLNHPSNPSETRFSERAYARFGGYFEAEVTEKSPLVVNYRLWLQSGEVTTEQATALRAAFAAEKSK